jgi:restriction system protein
MANQTLFSLLARSPWWLSLVIAAALFFGVRLILPDLAAAFAALPFVAIAAYAGWRQLRSPSLGNVEQELAGLQALPWEQISARLVKAWERDGYQVHALKSGAADFELTTDNRITLACCRRWKAANTGVGPLRELQAQVDARDAHDGLYIAIGTVTDNARDYAKKNNLRLMSAAELLRLLRR